MKHFKQIAVSVFLVVSILLTTSCSALQDLFKKEMSAEEIYEMVSPSVVEINAESSKKSSSGTGFFWDKKGTVVTNYHVIEDCTSATITLTSGKKYSVNKVLGYNKDRDIAILSTDCSVSVPLTIRSSEVHTGETVYAIGNSLGWMSGSLSDGIVSTAERIVDGEVYIQTTAPISSGNSGGPLLDKNGEVVGIIAAYMINGQNLNLAIPIDDVSKISTSSPKTLYELFKNQSQTNTLNYEDLGVTFAQYSIALKIDAGNPQAYCEYITKLDNMLSKGTYSDSIKKEKATEYLNILPLDYGQRIILFRIQFPFDTTYCNDIVDYLNERDDITRDDMVFILEELGFAVFEDGTVKW